MGRRYVRHRLYMVRPVQAGSVKPRRPVSTPGRTHISENLPASRKDKEYGMFEIINEMVKDCWAEKTAKTEAEKEAAVNQLKAFVAMFFEPEN